MENQTNKREEELVKIYNNAIEKLENGEGFYWTLQEQLKYAQGYMEALERNDLITCKEALELHIDLVDAIIEMNQKGN